jgi:FixJ family two-component response regulator
LINVEAQSSAGAGGSNLENVVIYSKGCNKHQMRRRVLFIDEGSFTAKRTVTQLTVTSNDRAATVFVIDDDQDVRESIGNLIQSVGLTVELFASTDNFLARGEWARPGCLVLDVRLPGRSGLDFQDDLARMNISLPIVFITAYSDIKMSVRAMKAGAVEFITKPARQQDLLDAIQTAIARDSAACLEAESIAGLKTKFATLTVREQEVMTLVVTGLLNKNIAARLGITEATVKLHRGNVMRKMGATSVPDLVRMADRLAIHTKDGNQEHGRYGLDD